MINIDNTNVIIDVIKQNLLPFDFTIPIIDKINDVNIKAIPNTQNIIIADTFNIPVQITQNR